MKKMAYITKKLPLKIQLAGVPSNSHKLMDMILMLCRQYVEGTEMPSSN
jgi:hypothetical protein